MLFRKKVVMILSSIFLSSKYLCLAFFSNKNIMQSNSGFVISLTSYGRRVKYVCLTIESLLHQKDIKPEKIILWLYKRDKPYGIAHFLLKRQVNRGLKIVYLDDDYKSYKKLSYFQDIEGSHEYVVTVDDDIIYPIKWLKGFFDCTKKNPNAIYCYRGRIINFDSKDNVTSYNSWRLANKKNLTNNFLLPTGVSGVCYPVRALDERVKDFKSISSICPYGDDIWYKMITLTNNFYSELVDAESIHFTPIITGFGKGLEKINVQSDFNTKQFVESMVHFNVNKQDFM